MFGILRDFIETIKMEMFGLKAETADLNLKTGVKRFDFEGNDVEIVDESVSVEIDGFSIDDVIEVVDGSLNHEKVEVESGSFGDPEVSVSEILEGVEVEILSAEFDYPTYVMEGSLDVEKPETFQIEKFIVVDRSDISLNILWRITLEPEPVVEKEKVLIAIERFLKKFGRSPKNLRFLGYYRGIPKGGVESITFVGDRMVLKLKPGTFPREKVDVVAFKTDRGIELEVV